jgi:hypothetical protein
METNFYNYIGLDKLLYNIDEYLNENLNENSKIKINAFEIKNSKNVPYLKYLLIKDKLTDILFFPELELSDYSELTSEKIIMLAQIQLYYLIQLNNSNLHEDDNYSKYDKNIRFKGFYLNDDIIHIFFDLTECNLHIDCTYRKSQLWFCLIDEIINYNKVCSLNIDSSVINFFITNIDFCYLKNKNNENYELPIVGYIGIQPIKLNFTYTFGISVKDKNAIMGPYYYFTDYKGSIRDGGWSETGMETKDNDTIITDNEYGRFKQGGIVRFALFLGKTKIVENLLNDSNDDSKIKKERLNDKNLHQNMEVLTMRISDHDGKWSEHNDSVFLGKIELDNGSYLKHTPIIVLKDYYQQIPLSYHYIDKSYLHEKYDENENYIIM